MRRFITVFIAALPAFAGPITTQIDGFMSNTVNATAVASYPWSPFESASATGIAFGNGPGFIFVSGSTDGEFGGGGNFIVGTYHFGSGCAPDLFRFGYDAPIHFGKSVSDRD